MTSEEMDEKIVTDYTTIQPFFVENSNLYNQLIKEVKEDILDKVLKSSDEAKEAHYELLALNRVLSKISTIIFKYEKLKTTNHEGNH